MIGENMLVFCGVGFAFVGRVKELNALGGVNLEDASMICRTGGVPWAHLAKGEKRPKMILTKVEGEVVTGPVSQCWEWAGDLPTEDQNVSN